MKTKHYFSKKITYLLFGQKYYHTVKSKKILFDYLIGKDYDDIYSKISKIISTEDTVLDIGANMGQYLSRLSKLINKGKIICIEPVPCNITALKYMRRKLKIKNAIIVDKAISSSIGKAIISIPTINDIPITTQASFLTNDNLEKELLEVETTTIDQIAVELNLPKINFIKIDTEGYDSTVLKSGMKIIHRDLPIIKIENNCFDAEFAWIFEIGYRAFKFNKHRVVLLNDLNDSKTYRGDSFLAPPKKIENILSIFNNQSI